MFNKLGIIVILDRENTNYWSNYFWTLFCFLFIFTPKIMKTLMVHNNLIENFLFSCPFCYIKIFLFVFMSFSAFNLLDLN